ncbi:MAG: hypothetical protein R3A78_09745 [Polyangiales bacterium]
MHIHKSVQFCLGWASLGFGAALAVSGCDGADRLTTEVVDSEPVDLNGNLPFDIDDPDATFSAEVDVFDGQTPIAGATVTLGNQSVTTDDDGRAELKNVKVRGVPVARVTMDGFMPRTAQLSYQSAGARALRVVLLRAGLVTTFSASVGARIGQGSATVLFPAGGFVDADGDAFDGEVTVAMRGLDASDFVKDLKGQDFTLRPDVDRDVVPDGFSMMLMKDGKLRMAVPESLVQVDLSDSTGGKVELADGQKGAIWFKLQAFSSHKAGDTVTLLAFDEAKRHWVEGGTCEVEQGDDDALYCVGTVSHFSYWSVSAWTADEEKAAPTAHCGNIRVLRVGNNAGESIRVRRIEVRGVLADSELAVSGIRQSAAGSFFVSTFPQVQLAIHYDYSASASANYVEREYVLAVTSKDFDGNIFLASNPEFGAQNLEDVSYPPADAFGCPPIVVMISGSAGEAPTDSCGGTCTGEQTCNATTGKCLDKPTACTPTNPCQNGGVCSLDGKGFRCACDAAWTGATCTTAVNPDPCSPNPCKHNSTCSPDGTTFECDCAAGWEGMTCETEVSANPCSPNPCKNGGTCNVDGTGFYCDCPFEWVGDTCEDEPDACHPNPCINGGTCALEQNGFICTCVGDYYGAFCHVLDDMDNAMCGFFEADNPCAFGGTCNEGGTSYTCSCNATWTGDNCTVLPSANVCGLNPCQHGGTCTDEGGGQYSCACTSGWSGTDCTTPDGGWCTPNPCDHGTCNDLGATYDCTCDQGWTGFLCDTVDNGPCAINPCQNGGVCNDVGGGQYSCSCSSGWTGPDCTTPDNGSGSCSPACVNGFCMFDSFTQMSFCVCDFGWDGPTCEIGF